MILQKKIYASCFLSLHILFYRLLTHLFIHIFFKNFHTVIFITPPRALTRTSGVLWLPFIEVLKTCLFTKFNIFPLFEAKQHQLYVSRPLTANAFLPGTWRILYSNSHRLGQQIHRVLRVDKFVINAEVFELHRQIVVVNVHLNLKT